ncbi:hypothetical protein F5Y17DRAFT_462798 [Xylariaceae sp. FL0594]|nr:hypothetical protein F5Y17DRAFT_462798 [Xylariaceae sp. FL0594]
MSTSNKVVVSVPRDEDIPTCFQVVSLSFGHDAPFVDIYFPAHWTSAGQAQASKRLLAWKRSGKSTFLKATIPVGDEEEKIIGLAIWTHMKTPPSAKLEDGENVEEVWPDADDREYMTRLWRGFVQPRRQAVLDSHGGAYVLELLAVHPDYQRRGAGSALVTWGTKAADQLGIRAVIEASPVGRLLYETCGFRPEIEEMRLDVGEEFAARPKPKLVYMTREPAS